jgi:hypothetical protein
MYIFLDFFFLIFHSCLIGFSLVGWIWEKYRKVHLLIVSLIMVSWFVLGIWYGFGYCPCTDWHWQVKRKMGETELPNSYVKYYADRFTGLDWESLLLDFTVVILGLAALVISVCLNWSDHKRDRGSNIGQSSPEE